MIQKRLEEVSEADLQALVAAQVSEGKTLEFKQELPGSSKEERREFLADASSFANSVGGDLIYGIREDDAVAAEVLGIETTRLNSAILTLIQVLRDNIEPRIEFDTHQVALANGGQALVVRVRQGWNGPHRVLAGDNKFYARNAKGKYPLDVDELRSAFLRSQVASERMEGFHQGRLVEISADRGMLPNDGIPLLVLHLLPMTAFTIEQQIDRAELYNAVNPLRPMGVGGYDWRITAEGFLTYNSGTGRYTHAYRNGIVEAVAPLSPVFGNQYEIPSAEVERVVVDAAARYATFLGEQGIRPPITAYASLVNAQGLTLATQLVDFGLKGPVKLNRRVLQLPGVVFSTVPPADVPTTLRPAFDVLWNAFGHPGSANFDDQGTWAFKDRPLG